MKPRIVKALELYQRRIMTQEDAFTAIALELAESGTPDEISELPDWLRERLFERADEVEKQPEGWFIVSNAGSRDVSAEWQKLLALIRQCQS